MEGAAPDQRSEFGEAVELQERILDTLPQRRRETCIVDFPAFTEERAATSSEDLNDARVAIATAGTRHSRNENKKNADATLASSRATASFGSIVAFKQDAQPHLQQSPFALMKRLERAESKPTPETPPNNGRPRITARIDRSPRMERSRLSE